MSWFLFDNYIEVSDAQVLLYSEQNLIRAAGRSRTHAVDYNNASLTQNLSDLIVESLNPQMEKLRKTLFTAPTARQWHNGFRALLFPFTAIAIGTATEHFLTHAGHGLGIPYTVAVLVEGGIFDWIVDWASGTYLHNAPILSRLPSFVAPFTGWTPPPPPAPPLRAGLGVFSDTGLPRINAPWQDTFEPFAPLWTNSMKLSIDMWANIDGHTVSSYNQCAAASRARRVCDVV